MIYVTHPKMVQKRSEVYINVYVCTLDRSKMLIIGK